MGCGDSWRSSARPEEAPLQAWDRCAERNQKISKLYRASYAQITILATCMWTKHIRDRVWLTGNRFEKSHLLCAQLENLCDGSRKQ